MADNFLAQAAKRAYAMHVCGGVAASLSEESELSTEHCSRTRVLISFTAIEGSTPWNIRFTDTGDELMPDEVHPSVVFGGGNATRRSQRHVLSAMPANQPSCHQPTNLDQ